MTKDGVSTSYTYNLANQLLTEVSQGVTKTYTYDNAGNLTTVTSGISTLKTYTYDAWGRQTGYSEPLNLVTATYTYGPDNLRRSKTVGSNTTSYVWSGDNMVYESTGNSGTVYRYGATIFASDDGTATYTYLLNGHGDVVQMLVGTTVVKSYKYDAFGNEIGINMADTNPFRYCAQYYDKESGTIYLRARYYAPGQGRFTQQDSWAYADPNNPWSLNLYAYCWNNPITFIDIMGNWPTWSQFGKAALIAAVAVVSVAAIVATAGTAAAAVGTGVAMYIGASATTAATIITVATVGAYGVAAGVGAVAASDIGEVFTGHNVIRDDFMGGNQRVYDATRMSLDIAGIGVVQLGTPSVSPNNIKNKGAYTSPKGGGGITATIKCNGKIITFGHGARHLEGTTLSIDTVNKKIAENIANLSIEKDQFIKRQITIKEVVIEYTAYGRGDNKINVGTYYIVKP